MPKYQVAILGGVASLASVALAGVQVPLVVVNLSPWAAEVDMSLGGENCLYHDFNPNAISYYKDSWESNNLDDFGDNYGAYSAYLQQYKQQLGVPHLNGHEASGMTDKYLIQFLSADDAKRGESPILVFETEVDNSGGCNGATSRKPFAITVNGNRTEFLLEDPANSHWSFTLQSPTNNHEEAIDIGSNSYGPLPGALADSLSSLHTTFTDNKVRRGGAVLPRDTTTFGFSDLYNKWDSNDRHACILGKDVFGYDCMVAGTSIVIQKDGSPVAVPLPDIYRAWNN